VFCSHRCKSRQFFWGANDILPEFPQISWKKLYTASCLSAHFLQLLVHHIFLHKVAIYWKQKIWYRTWNLVLTQLKKVRYFVQEHCQKPAGSVFLSICLTLISFEVFHSHSSCYQQGASDLTASFSRSQALRFGGEKYIYRRARFLFSLYFLLNIFWTQQNLRGQKNNLGGIAPECPLPTVTGLWLCSESYNIVCSNTHVCRKLYGKMCLSKHRSSKLKQKFFCTCLAWTLLIWSRCPAVNAIPSVYKQARKKKCLFCQNFQVSQLLINFHKL